MLWIKYKLNKKQYVSVMSMVRLDPFVTKFIDCFGEFVAEEMHRHRTIKIKFPDALHVQRLHAVETFHWTLSVGTNRSCL